MLCLVTFSIDVGCRFIFLTKKKKNVFFGFPQSISFLPIVFR